MDTIKQLAEQASRLTTNPGVYLMKDRQGSVLYVGKAKNLRNRVRTYFQSSIDSPKTRIMVSRVIDFETIVTPTEQDAFILENTLIKQHRPRYNVVFRDDKDYPCLRLAIKEPYPNLTIARRPRKDGAHYFGPFASALAVRETLKVINRLFPLRKCNRRRLAQGRPCVYHQLGQCTAPCSGGVDPALYAQTVRQVELFLRGRSAEVLSDLKARMQEASAQMHFERAAQLRDSLRAVEQTLAKQVMVCHDRLDRDVFACAREADRMAVTILFVRGGRITGSRDCIVRSGAADDQDALASFVSQYYQQHPFIPDEVVLPFKTHDTALLEHWLRGLTGTAVRVLYPQRGSKKDLIAMAARNAEIALQKNRGESSDALEELRGRLHLQRHPHRIACCDISNIMGTDAVGSIVVFEDGLPQKKAYRTFRIKNVHQPDDYAMMYEVLQRYLGHTHGAETPPDLFMVDGGKGQLAILLRVLQEAGCESIDAASLAKGPERDRAKRDQTEKVFIPNRKNPVTFPHNSQALFLLQRIRDEAHRCAVSFHRRVKRTKDFSSELAAIPGIGPKTVQALLRHFGSLERVRSADPAQICAVPGLSAKRARTVFDALHAQDAAGNKGKV
ncbi:MAG: excinuclease ABC subunit UvrC [Deltaproteobacteria bacterium]|nr:excinuclease ABC subunit UvrC [Deltaproteobacteria bacterium]